MQHWFTSEIFFSFFELLTSNSKDILEPHPNLQPQAVWSFFFLLKMKYEVAVIHQNNVYLKNTKIKTNFSFVFIMSCT